jgi:predicted O-methyltransferase YrrM
MRQTKGQDIQPNSYLEQLFPSNSLQGSPFDDFLVRAKSAAEKLNKEGISILPYEGRLLANFIRQVHCKKFVEIGTLTGYSALWILQALQKPAQLFTLEKDLTHASIATEILNDACKQLFLDSSVKIIPGDAMDSLPELSKEGPFDGVFIDGNKSAYLDYLKWSETNIREGGVIIADNVFLSGAVWGKEVSHFSKKQIEVLQQFNQRLADPKKFKTIFIPTSEGLAVAEKL